MTCPPDDDPIDPNEGPSPSPWEWDGSASDGEWEG